jgi:hypothetical protein
MGKRTGNPRGRPKGAKSTRTVEREAAMQEARKKAAETLGVEAFDGDAHALLMLIYKNTAHPIELRVDAAKAAIGYEKPRLAAVDNNLSGHLGYIAVPVERRDSDAIPIPVSERDPVPADWRTQAGQSPTNGHAKG